MAIALSTWSHAIWWPAGGRFLEELEFKPLHTITLRTLLSLEISAELAQLKGVQIAEEIIQLSRFNQQFHHSNFGSSYAITTSRLPSCTFTEFYILPLEHSLDRQSDQDHSAPTSTPQLACLQLDLRLVWTIDLQFEEGA